MSTHARIRVNGVVQGVGFRYFAYRKAKELKLYGYVRNRPDGSVESEVEGPDGLVHEYLKALKIGPSFSHVTQVDVEWLECENKYHDFNITY